uniref:L-2-amino-thiazoline-4-carboxylic acid hydrolase n=1 Tax=Olsenella uli TaxID=133926 RepID=UPI0028EC723D|nr:L-2-amino-thiazoline-4-carboxylic acid hydrolase [Olsenella uli]
MVTVLGLDAVAAKAVIHDAKPKYRELIAGLPEFERADRFKVNIVSCAMLAAVILNMPKRPDVETLTEFYEKAMMNRLTRWFCHMSGKSKFSDKEIHSMQETARLKAADRNPYSWNMDLYLYPGGSGYEARFTKCGICTLMKELGLYDLVPAMCSLDYAMAEAGGNRFVREYTLASGGPYCDCGYKK